jgi:hypothetical protein
VLRARAPRAALKRAHFDARVLRARAHAHASSRVARPHRAPARFRPRTAVASLASSLRRRRRPSRAVRARDDRARHARRVSRARSRTRVANARVGVLE